MSRIGAFIALISVIGWVSYVVYKTAAIPSLDGPALFVGTLYGLGKAGQTIQAFGPKGDSNG